MDEELQLFKERETLSQYRIKETGEKITLEWLKKITAIYQQRLKKLSEITELTDFFFKDKLQYPKDLLKWKEMSDKEIKIALERARKIISKIKTDDWNKENLEKILIKEAEKFAMKIGKVGDRGCFLWPLRVALTGKEASATPFEIAEILGKEKTIKRLKEAIHIIG